ncbi:L-xylulose reductase isoform X1 [Takifugu flavidus]|uniref:L-xylulose reductase isoform X1 n=1 Tax=Takifugu flavidus TaxID=433684 RepID=UPI002544BA32|nr:L-xylulose reductase isoform X1 [Takifugu flavidus]
MRSYLACAFAQKIMAEKRKRTYVFNDGWEEEFFFTSFKDKCLCLICGTTVAVPKRHNVERHFKTCHGNFDVNYPPGSALRTEKDHGLKASLDKQRTFFTKPMKKSQNATEASFRAAHFLIKNKKTFSDGEVFKETMMLVANTLFKDEKHGPEVISALSDVQLGASTMARRVSSLSENLTEQVERDLAACRWFSIQCDESVDSASTAQLMIFIRMVFDDFSTKEELLTLLPLKATTRGVDKYTAVKNFFAEKKVPLNKLASITTDGAPAMTGRHAGFIAQCRNDPDFPTFLHYHCIIHQQGSQGGRTMGQRQGPPLDESPVHNRAQCEHLGVPYLAQGYHGSAPKVFWHLRLKPRTSTCQPSLQHAQLIHLFVVLCFNLAMHFISSVLFSLLFFCCVCFLCLYIFICLAGYCF